MRPAPVILVMRRHVSGVMHTSPCRFACSMASSSYTDAEVHLARDQQHMTVTSVTEVTYTNILWYIARQCPRISFLPDLERFHGRAQACLV